MTIAYLFKSRHHLISLDFRLLVQRIKIKTITVLSDKWHEGLVQSSYILVQLFKLLCLNSSVELSRSLLEYYAYLSTLVGRRHCLLS